MYKKPTVSSVTLENYHYSFLHIQREFTGVNIEDLTPLRIQRFLNKLSLTKHNGNFLSKRTIEGVYGVLNQALKMAVKQKIIPVNPIDEGVLMPKTKQTTLKKQKAIPKEICKEVMDVINQSPTYKPIITVLFRTGLRIGEAMALKWRDIDREKMLLHVNKAITSEVEFDENLNPISRKAVVGKGKTAASIRDVTISDELLRVLDEWKDHKNSQDKKSKTAKPKSDDDFIFITKIGGIRRYDCFRSQFTRFLKEKCLEKYGITFHRFRHTFATMLMEQGINPRVVQELLGHRDIATTLGIYTSVSTENMENATNKFNTALNELLNCEKGEPLK